MKSKKALSPIISIVLIIALTIASVAIVFNVVKNLSEEKLDDAKSCLDVMGAAEINAEYTCYNSSVPEVRISISRKNIDLNAILIAISSGQESRTFLINNTGGNMSDIVNYPSRTTNISLPDKEGGKTYSIGWDLGNPETIEIAPYVDGKMCNSLDKIYDILNCA